MYKHIHIGEKRRNSFDFFFSKINFIRIDILHTNVYKTVGETKITSNSPSFVHIAFIHWRLQNSFHSKLLTYTPVSGNKKVSKIKTKHIYLYMYLIYTFFLIVCVCVFFLHVI